MRVSLDLLDMDFHLRWKCEIAPMVQGSVAVIIIIRVPIKKEKLMSCCILSHNNRGHVVWY